MVVKPSMACRRPMPAVSSSGGRRPPVLLDGFDRLAHAIDGVADGVGEIAIEQKEFEDAVGGEVGGIDLAIGFEGRAAAQKADLLKILIAGVLALRRMRTDRADRPRAVSRWRRRARDIGRGG